MGCHPPRPPLHGLFSHTKVALYNTGTMAELVYLETSVVSALFDQRPDPVCRVQYQQSQGWYDQESGLYRLCGSAAVIEELQAGTYDHQFEAVLFAEKLDLLPVSDEVLGVARIYAQQLVMPKANLGDALHLAVASVHAVDFLLTWNCRHLANPNKVKRIAEINRRLGLITPQIATPAMLYKEDEP